MPQDYFETAVELTEQHAAETVYSHWIEFDAPMMRGRRQRAECGRTVPADTFSTEPTCPDCRRKLDEYERATF